jgi:hypothetical protein
LKIIREPDRFHFDGDHEAFAEWMLSVIDKSPDRLALFPMPHRDTDEGLDELEDVVRAAYDLAKAKRPNLAVKILHGVDLGNGVRNSEIVVVIHEHQWVAGHCVNGCPDTRKGDGS